MDFKHLQVSQTTIYRQVSQELIVIQLDTGHFYYFDAHTKSFLDCFKEPQDFQSLIQRVNPDEHEKEDTLEYLKNFCKFLLKNQILVEVDSDLEELSPNQEPLTAFQRPTFLRKGEKTLDEVTFLCP